MHEHEPPAICAHELKFCVHCNVVYCEKCKQEWKQQSVSALLDRYAWPKAIGDGAIPYRPKRTEWGTPYQSKREDVILCTHGTRG